MVVSERFRDLLMAIRQADIIQIGAIEEYLEMERSIIPRHRRGKEDQSVSIEHIDKGEGIAIIKPE